MQSMRGNCAAVTARWFKLSKLYLLGGDWLPVALCQLSSAGVAEPSTTGMFKRFARTSATSRAW